MVQFNKDSSTLQHDVSSTVLNVPKCIAVGSNPVLSRKKCSQVCNA